MGTSSHWEIMVYMKSLDFSIQHLNGTCPGIATVGVLTQDFERGEEKVEATLKMAVNMLACSWQCVWRSSDHGKFCNWIFCN